jgi:hypothetical protein
MLYVIYNKSTDIDEVVTEYLTDALEEAGKLIDSGASADEYSVLLIHLSPESYQSHDWSYIQNHVESAERINDFLNKYGITSDPVKEVEPVNKEMYHNLDKAEQLEVLKFVSDQMLIDELNRRLNEYRTYADTIREAGDKMRIYV